MSEANWRETLDQLLAGDRLAFARLARVVTGALSAARAYDFRDEWDDLVQDVIWTVIENARAERIENPDALAAYVRTTTRQMFRARLRRLKRLEPREDLDQRPEDLCWPQVDPGLDSEELWEQVGRLPEPQRRAIEAKYREGRTQQEASRSTGMPVGTLKRHLSEGIATLKRRMSRDETVEPGSSDELVVRGREDGGYAGRPFAGPRSSQ